MTHTILITGASSGFGMMMAKALASAGHVVYASMRDLSSDSGRKALSDYAAFSGGGGVDLRTIALDVSSEPSVTAAIGHIVAEAGRLDVLVHNAGHMCFGPTEAFTPEQLAEFYDVNVLGTQRVNRAALPHMRGLGRALLVWIGSTSTRGGHPPFLAPYFAAKAGMDSLAESYAAELTRFGIETTILLPGAFTTGTSHFAHAGKPADAERAAAYMTGPYEGTDDAVLNGLAALEPEGSDPNEVAEAIVRIVAMPHGTRPFRVHVDPARDGADIVNGVADRMREQMLERIGLKDLLHPA